MLCRGLGVNKKNGIVKYGLDFIPGAVDSCVAFFSYYRSSRHFKGQCVEIMRGSDYATAWFGYKGSLGYIDYIAIALFCSGTTGKVKTWVNGSVLAGNNAVQNNYANMPIIYESGTFNADGLKFVIASSNYMSIVDYAGIQIIEPPLTIYANAKISSSHVGYYLYKGLDSTINSTYGIYNSNLANPQEIGIILKDFENYANQESDTIIEAWTSKAANGLKIKSSTTETLLTYGINTTNYNNVYLGCRADAALTRSRYLNGNIKSIIIFNSNQYDNYTQLASKF